ncbi:hypothetical protein D3C87_1140950 [compost metagenome]
MRALHHPPDGKHSTQGEGKNKRRPRQSRATVTQYKEQRKQREPGCRMTARPAAARFFRGRSRAQQFTVGLVTAELFKAPRALHRRHCFHRRDKGRRQTQGQHQTAQFPFERLEPGHEERAGKAKDGKYRESDDHLFGAIVQDRFQEITVSTDEIPSGRVVEQLGQIHVQRRQFEQHQNDRRNGGNSKANPEVERARSGADKGRSHAGSLIGKVF